MPASTVRQALASAAQRLAPSETARRDAELLLLHILRCDRAELLTHPGRPLTPEELARYRDAISRRFRHEPVQYITGVQEFYGLTLQVTPAVLIPRPETEHLVEAALTLAGAAPGRSSFRPTEPTQHAEPSASCVSQPSASCVSERSAVLRILDIGTGSGAIALALAAHLPHASVTATDISPPALHLACDNAARHHLADRIRFVQSDLLSALPGEQFHLIVSNPPYVAVTDTLEPQVADYEPHTALYAGPTGLEVYQRLIPQAGQALAPGGWLLLEIGQGQQPALARLLEGWRDVSFENDLQSIPRVALAQRP